MRRRPQEAKPLRDHPFDPFTLFVGEDCEEPPSRCDQLQNATLIHPDQNENQVRCSAMDNGSCGRPTIHLA